MCQPLPGGATPPRCTINREQLLRRAEELAARGLPESDYWAELAFYLRRGVWPDEAEERLAIQQEPRMLPEDFRRRLRR